ncbi:hypothetical protein ES703_28225 [subsurface metagenome]
MIINKNNIMSKKIFILFGALFLILFLGSVSAEDICWVELNSADCVNNNGKVVMSVSDATNAHGALAGQGTFAPVLCCDFGEGDTTYTLDNKIIGLSSSTNAHAEAPDLVSPNYNIYVCYDSLKFCSSIDAGFSCGIGEIEVVYISDTTNAHIEEAGLTSQNYDSKICCLVEYPVECDLTTAEWQYEEVMEEGDVGAIVNGTEIGCSGVEISFEVFREKIGTDDACSDITGCENPANVVFGAGSDSMAGTWTVGPVHDNEYYFVATVVANPDESVTSSEPNLLVIVECPYDPEPVICGDYINENACNSNICGIDVQDSVPTGVDCSDLGITCECIWENNECKGSWGGGDGGYCGDGVIDAGETCDGTTWEPITNCSDFDVFTGGVLSCDNCQFNTSLCTGGIDGGYCGDGVINPGETCDGINWEPITGCSDFGAFTGGTLTCAACQFDTSQCVGPEGAGPEVGTCIYTQFTDDDCDDGFLTFNWTAEWVWDEECDATCQTENSDLAAQCADGQKTVECPAQIPLPFFNIYSFIAALIIIALIYVILILRKEKRKR